MTPWASGLATATMGILIRVVVVAPWCGEGAGAAAAGEIAPTIDNATSAVAESSNRANDRVDVVLIMTFSPILMYLARFDSGEGLIFSILRLATSVTR